MAGIASECVPPSWGNARYDRACLGMDYRRCQIFSNTLRGAEEYAHVLYEAGANDEAGEVISNWLPGYDLSGMLHGHIAWHSALIALWRGDVEAALGIYANDVAPSVSRGLPINVISDTSSFLWRMQAYGHEGSEGLWQDVANYASSYFQQPGIPFLSISTWR